jgi:hypothetical protein
MASPWKAMLRTTNSPRLVRAFPPYAVAVSVLAFQSFVALHTKRFKHKV